MAARTLNIELGKRICKVCVSNKKGKAYEISESFTFATPENAVVDGQIIDAVALGEELKNELNNHAVYLKNAIFSIASTKVATREVTMPLAKDDQVKNIVATNATDYFPVDVTKYKIDSVILDKSENECRVLVFAVPQVIIDSYINLAEQASLKISALDFCADSQYQVLRTLGGEGVSMFVTVQTDSTSVLFIEGTTLLMQRMLINGADSMVGIYMEEHDLNEYQYIEAIKQMNVSAEEPEAKFDTASIQVPLNQLAAAISRSIDFFKGGKFAEKEIERVVLMGTCSHIAGLKDKIGESTGVETIWLEEIEGIAGLANSVHDISIYIDCLGSNLGSLSLLPKEYLEKTGNQGKYDEILKQNYGKMLLIFGVALAIILVGSQFAFNIIKKKELETVNKRISDIQYTEEEYNKYISYTEGSKSIQSFINGSKKNNAFIVNLFEEMEAGLPSSVTVQSISCSNDGISINIQTPGFYEAIATVRAFRGFESFKSVSISGFSRGNDVASSNCNISLSCSYADGRVEKLLAEQEQQKQSVLTPAEAVEVQNQAMTDEEIAEELSEKEEVVTEEGAEAEVTEAEEETEEETEEEETEEETEAENEEAEEEN